MLQQDFDHRQSGVEVDIRAHKLPHIFLGLFRSLIHLAKDGQDHSEAKQDEAKTTNRGNDFVAVLLSVAKLGGLKEVVESVHLRA